MVVELSDNCGVSIITHSQKENRHQNLQSSDPLMYISKPLREFEHIPMSSGSTCRLFEESDNERRQ